MASTVMTHQFTGHRKEILNFRQAPEGAFTRLSSGRVCRKQCTCSRIKAESATGMSWPGSCFLLRFIQVAFLRGSFSMWLFRRTKILIRIYLSSLFQHCFFLYFAKKANYSYDSSKERTGKFYVQGTALMQALISKTFLNALREHDGCF